MGGLWWTVTNVNSTLKDKANSSFQTITIREYCHDFVVRANQ